MTPFPNTTYNSHNYSGGDGFMAGTIRCAAYGCGKAMTKKVCSCGNTTCYILLYWRGKNWAYRRDGQGDVFTYGKATKTLNAIRESIDNRTFDPEARTDSKIRERQFENKWEEFIEEKDEKMRGHELSPSYVRILKSYRRKYFDLLNGYDVRDIQLEQLAHVKRGLRDCKIKTRKNVMNALSSFFRWLLNEDGTIDKLPKFPTIEGDDATPQGAINRTIQIEALARIPEQFRDPIEFGMETGCRPGEICALKVKDIQGDKALICRTWSDYTIRETTKQKKKQFIPLSIRAREIVERNCRDKHPEAWLFINPRSGNVYRPKTLGNIWREYSGVEIKLYEATRHSFCTQLVSDKVPLPIISQLARHSDIRTTMKYVHPTHEAAMEAVNNRGLGEVVELTIKKKSKRTSEGEK